MSVLYRLAVFTAIWLCMAYSPGLCSHHGNGSVITSFLVTLAGSGQAVNEVNAGVDADIICDATGDPLPDVDIFKYSDAGQNLGSLGTDAVNYQVLPDTSATQPGRKAYRFTPVINATFRCENHVDGMTLQLVVRHQPVPLDPPTVDQEDQGELIVHRSTAYRGDGPVVAMVVQTRPFGGNTWNTTREVTGDKYVISGLTAGSRYKVRLVLARPGEGGRGAPGPDVTVRIEFIEGDTFSGSVIVGSLLGIIILVLLSVAILHTVYKSRKEANMFALATFKLEKGELTSIPKEITGKRLAYLRLHTGEWKKTGNYRVEGEDIDRYMETTGFDGLIWQFEGLPDELKYKCKVARRNENKSKNRYKTFVPYDYSRVQLQPLPGKPDSDYINASWVNGYSKPKAFIAAQGPSAETVDDFWRMVWEYGPKYIVMMSDLTDKTKVPCAQYWPDDEAPLRSGDLIVTLKKKDVMADYTFRTLVLQKAEDEVGSQNQITHIQYTGWPVHRAGTPPHSTSLLNLVRTIKLTDPEELVPPIVVHCASGVDQTAVFIALYAMTDMLEEEDAVNIREFVVQMREYRCLMVQVVDHYMYIYGSVLEAERCGNTVVRTDEYLAYAESKLGLNGSKRGALYCKEFARLQTLCPNPSPERTATGSLPANESKNRFSNLLPDDKRRVTLSTPLSDKEGNDYINAVYLDSYRRQNGYIATQAPLANTVTDFWCMISDTNSNIIVMLNNMSESCPRYWPVLASATYGPFNVEVTNTQKAPHVTEREFQLTNTFNQKKTTVRQFQLTNYTDDGDSAPLAAPEHLYQLWTEVHKWYKQSNTDGPITVHCESGAGLSGVFCTVDMTLDRSGVEGAVDVFQAARMLRHHRPEMVCTEDQYKLCYQVVQKHLQTTPTTSP
ncbi:PTPRS [Branchiostoma lanceolatum]|uniref:Tyrosine-protein phosphatase non-receptor type 20 n=1 Tax=Branchiostoma lanceolatum TaxID=7740 RepID=A0A8J9YXE3_BRALA|nr:PTPRS [Branchiostoma lanceolatum]